MKRISMLFILIVMSLIVIGCSSTPEEEVSEVPEVTETEIVDFAEKNAQGLVQADAARAAALALGAQEMFAEDFAKIDSLYEEVKSSISSDATVDKTEILLDLTNKYKAMENLVEAERLRDKIEEYDFLSVDEAELKTGDEAVVKAKELLSVNGTEAFESARLAKASYVNVLNKGFIPLCEEQKAEAASAKEQADSIKSAVAEKEKYAAISLIYDGANTAYTEQAYELAYEGFSKSAVMFNDLYKVVSVKRAEAEAAIARAKEKVATTENFAVEADEIAPLSEEEEK